MSDRYSYSKLDCYKQCHFMFKLKYIDGHYVSASSIALDIGILIHETEESIANSIKNKEQIDYIKLKNNIILKMQKIEHKFPKDFWEKDKSGRYYKEKIYNYLDSGIYRLENYMKEHPTFEIIGAEVPFKVEISGKNFTGKIDRVLRDSSTNTYICHDVKTYAVEVAKEDLVTPLQFVVYTKAIEELYNIDENHIICGYDLPFCNIIQQAGTKGFMKRGLDKINKLLEGIDSQDFAVNPSPLCYFCPYCRNNPTAKKEDWLCPYYCLWTREYKTFETLYEWQGIENHELIMESFRNQIGLKD